MDIADDAELHTSLLRILRAAVKPALGATIGGISAATVSAAVTHALNTPLFTIAVAAQSLANRWPSARSPTEPRVHNQTALAGHAAHLIVRRHTRGSEIDIVASGRVRLAAMTTAFERLGHRAVAAVEPPAVLAEAGQSRFDATIVDLGIVPLWPCPGLLIYLGVKRQQALMDGDYERIVNMPGVRLPAATDAILGSRWPAAIA